MTFLLPSTDNPLLHPDMKMFEVGPMMIIGAILLALLLGHAIYTDIFCGKIIRNEVTGTTWILGLISIPFLYENFGSLALIILGIYFFLFLILLSGAAKMGDIKLYAGLTLFLSWAGIYMIFLSWFVVIVYSIPIMIKTVRDNKAAGIKAERGQRLGQAPAGPSIVIAFYLTVGFMGADWKYVGAMALISLITAGLFLAFDKKGRAKMLKERDERLAEREAEKLEEAETKSGSSSKA